MQVTILGARRCPEWSLLHSEVTCFRGFELAQLWLTP